MLSAPLSIVTKHRLLLRILWWVSVIVYTIVLPWVILVFNEINRYFSSDITDHASHFIMILLGISYSIICARKKLVPHCLIILAVGVAIVFLIMNFETNPNKYIHVPEYVLMT